MKPIKTVIFKSRPGKKTYNANMIPTDEWYKAGR